MTLGAVFLSTHETSAITWHAFKEFLVEKENENATQPIAEMKERVFRLAYGTVLNFVFIENLGPMIKAKLRGQFPSEYSIFPLIARDLIYALVVGMALGAIFVASAIRLMRGQPGIGASCAAVLGILTFAAYWNLAEADFYYQLTLPIYLMACWISPVRFRLAIAIALCSISLFANFANWAVPKAQYPFDRYVDQLQDELGDEDLIVAFRAYPGKQCMAFFLPHLAERPRVLVDELASVSSDKTTFFKLLSEKLHERTYRRIVLFGVLDPIDFNAPIPKLWQMDISKPDLEAFFQQQGEVTVIPAMAEIPCWELRLSRDRS
jgi:hypothetical protein